MKLFIDDEFKCHISDDGTMREAETDFLNGKCDAFIEGYRFVPAGAVWCRADGTVFPGEMLSPWKPYGQLLAMQEAADRVDARRDEELAALIEEIYRNDLEVIG